jgi:hypothetical protein
MEAKAAAIAEMRLAKAAEHEANNVTLSNGYYQPSGLYTRARQNSYRYKHTFPGIYLYMATHREAKDLPAATALMLAFNHE